MDTTILFPLYDSFQAMTILSAQAVTTPSGSGRLLLGSFFIYPFLSLLTLALYSFCTRTFSGHTAWVRFVQPSEDGRYLVSGGDDHVCIMPFTLPTNAHL
jgi:WD40 repeat protein